MPSHKTKGKKRGNSRKTGRKSVKRNFTHRKGKFSFKKWLLKWTFVAGIWGAIAISIVLAYFAYDLPDVNKLYEDYRTPNITILDMNGDAIASVGNLYGEYAPYNKLPKNLINAVTSTEDRRFFSHWGIDPWGILRAAVTNYRAKRVVQGGSTITQQLAKVVFLTQERKLKRKIQEVLLAVYLERNFSKEDIITMYLNRIYFGSGNYGVSAAAESYFGKKVEDLNLFECATLAGMIKAPSRYSPANNFELSQDRADQVLRLMVDNNAITTDDIINGGINQNFVVQRYNVQSRYPYFIDWIKEQLPDYIGSEQGQIIVKTTLDPNMQQAAQKAIAQRLNELGESKHIGQGAAVIMTPDGKVRAMVGGRDYSKSQFNRAYQALRQPGSSFKFFVYLTAMESGYKPDDTIFDEEVNLKGWSPKNWDNKYMGEISLRTALAKSVNTAAVKLAQAVGINKIINTAYRLGITSEINRDLTSALGSSEVNLIELTGAYAHMANYGNSVWVHGIEEISNNKGNILYQRNYSGEHRVVSPQVTAEMNDMLLNVVENGTGKRAQISRQVAGKTGTSQDFRDAWFVGYTQDLVAGVWVGNDDNTPMLHVGGSYVPALIWHDFMSDANQGRGSRDLPTTEYSVQKGRKNLWDSIVETFGGKSDDGGVQ